MPNTIDSNVVGLSYAEEDTLGVVASPVFYPLDPNDYSDFGAELSMVARNPINASRQRRKGVVTDLDASGGFSQDITQSNLTRLMQGFFFADLHELPTTHSLSGVAATTVGVADIEVSGVINLDGGDGAKFVSGMLLKSSGMANAANNIDVMKITGIATDELTVDVNTTVVEASPAGKLEVVGFEFASGDAELDLTNNVFKFKTTAQALTGLNFQVGEWIFIGGDSADECFSSTRKGYARVEAVGANELTLKEPTWTAATDTGTGKTIRIYRGAFLRNEKVPANIKTRSYHLERTLGDDGSGTQSEILTGAIANEYTLNVASADKLTCDMSFVGTNSVLRTGSDGLLTGNRDATIPIEDAYNTSSDVYQQRLFVHGAAPTPTSLFAYVTDASITINNNATGQKAIGELGSFSISTGDFEVSGNLEVYFASIAAVSAVKNNSDVGYNLIVADDNAGFVYDIPLLSLGGGRVTVEKDEPIMLPLEKQAAENVNGYTISGTYFSYLPTVAMPTT
tara:strand:- start:815 stop:2347 length:1533 start_codon:yes stop_codon:yes gene_type:complete